MTISELEDAVVEFFGQNTSDLIWYRSNEASSKRTAPKVWSGFIPRDQVGAIMPGDITTYPCIIIQAKSGLQTIQSELVEVDVVLGTFDDTPDQQGYRDLSNMVQRLKDRLREQDIIRERFPLRMPLKWVINRYYGGASTNYFPYFFAEMTLNFELEVMMTQYDVTFGDADIIPGRLNEVPIPGVWNPHPINPPPPVVDHR
jgi:hypothetical protein